MARGIRAGRFGTAFREIHDNMKRTNQCPKCGSRDVITDAKAIDRVDNGALSVATLRKPGAVLFKGMLTTTLSAWVCADCGYLELYADNPKSIKVAAA